MKPADYCVTATKRNNPNNHVASEFYTWSWGYYEPTGDWRWINPRWEKSTAIAELINSGYSVITGDERETEIFSGSKIEVELRVKSNGGHYNISDLPDYP